MDNPSNDFLSLAATLLDALPPSGQSDKAMSTDYRWHFDSLAPLVADIPPVQDQAMLQLHALFGPMLMSALQLIDRREGEWRGSTIVKSIRCAEEPIDTPIIHLVVIMERLTTKELTKVGHLILGKAVHSAHILPFNGYS
ncbi:hypothetical protein JCM24511_05150 [Saitozyma sp. JCM 24511]|nr:hypothetical protein JCM24511_05150 [Saitozyma sp. JCM 24511]